MQNVTVIIPTFNSIRTLETCLISVNNQNYPHRALKLLAVDGGSTDGTLEILAKYHATIIRERTGSPEAAKSIALQQATSDFVLFLPSDNILPHRLWLSNMMDVFQKEPQIVGVYPGFYQWRSQDSILTRYFALLGANDPVAWFLGKADKKSYSNKKDESQYQIATFTERNLPTIGDNGFIIKRSILKKAQDDQDHFFHIDVCLDLVRLGYDQFAIVNCSIIHDTGDHFFDFFRKRYRYLSELYLNKSETRRYHVYDSKRDNFKLILFVFYSITLIGPTLFTLVGMYKKKDIAWAMHPLVCIAITVTYSLAIIRQCRKYFVKPLLSQ